MWSAVVANNVPKLRKAKARDEACKHPKWPKLDHQERLCELAIEKGSMEALACLRDMGCAWSRHAFRLAKIYDRRAIFEWLLEQPGALAAATSDVGALAIRWGDVELLARVHALGVPLDEVCVRAAAAEGRVDMLQWLEAHGCPLDEAMRPAIEYTLQHAGGHLECVAWLQEESVTGAVAAMDTKWCALAAESGHQHVLAWLHEHGFAWDKSTIYAAFFGIGSNRRAAHVQCLRYALAHGCQLETWNGLVDRRFYLGLVVREHLLPRWRWMVKVRPYALHWLEEHAQRLGAPGGVDHQAALDFVA